MRRITVLISGIFLHSGAGDGEVVISGGKGRERPEMSSVWKDCTGGSGAGEGGGEVAEGA